MSVDRAFEFLDLQVDRAGAGTGPRLPRSYDGGRLATLPSGFVYDAALAILAWLARGTAADRARAADVGDALVAAQRADPAGDGRIRNSYFAGGSPVLAADASATTGNQAWVGIAFLRLHAVTGEPRYLDAAHSLARWVHETQADARPGYRGGCDARNSPLLWKSTEHNADVVAFFRGLAAATGQRDWLARADTAHAFLLAMVDEEEGFLFTGTTNDGTTPVRTPVPLDAQTWPFLATRDAALAPALDWASRVLAAPAAAPAPALAAGENGIKGVSFSTEDTSALWLEGTAQLAVALRVRDQPGDTAAATALLDTVWAFQAEAPTGDGRGVIAASRDGLRTGFGDEVHASLHVGATAWAIFAGLGVNPLGAAASEK